MRKAIQHCVLFVALLLAFTKTCAQTPTGKPFLTNDDVIDLLQAGLSPEVVTAKIRSSTCSFDTSPTALKRLNAAHIPNSVILAVVQAPAAGVGTNDATTVNCQPGGNSVSVWSAPGTLTEIEQARCGERVEVLETSSLWMKVRTETGKIGFISRAAVQNSNMAGPISRVSISPVYHPPVATQQSEVPVQPPKTVEQRMQPQQVTRTSPSHLGSSCSPTIESTITGDFEGWEGETLFKLDNGQIWEQAEYDYEYDYEYRPDVTIYQTSGGCKMKVEGMDSTIIVRKIH